MIVSKLYAATQKLLTDAAGVDGKLTKTEAKKLPEFIRSRVDATRPTPYAKVAVADAFTSVWHGGNGLKGVQEGLVDAQRDPKDPNVVKTPNDVSKAERARITDPVFKATTDLLWSIAETAAPELNGVELKPLKPSEVAAAAKLLTSILQKLDNGDDVLTVVEVQLADIQYKGSPDPLTATALTNAVNRAKNQGSREVSTVARMLDDACKEIVAENVDGDGTLSPLELKKVDTVLGRALLAFAQAHKGHKLSDFSLTPEPIYVPKNPFKAPWHAKPETFVTALAKHVNAFSNDNKGAGPNSVSRIVMGAVETAGMAKEISKLTPSYARAVLKALEARIQLPKDYLGDPQRIYLTPEGQELMGQVAKKVGGTYNFAGIAAPPRFDYY